MAVGLETMEHEGTAGAGFAGRRPHLGEGDRPAGHQSISSLCPQPSQANKVAPPGRERSQNRSKAVAWPLLYTTCPVR